MSTTKLWLSVCMILSVACVSFRSAEGEVSPMAYFGPGYHPCDTNQDVIMGDWELLHAIDAWAGNERINGWPENLDDFDWALLELIDLWARGWYSAWVSPSGQEEGEPDVDVPAEDNSELLLDITLPGIRRQKVFIRELQLAKTPTAYDVISAPGCALTDKVGFPQLPVLTRYISIPPGSTATLQIQGYQEEDVAGYNVLPVQKALPDIPDAPQPAFAKNEEFYRTGGFYPEVVAELEPAVVVRGHDIAILRVYLTSFDPSTGSMKVRTTVDLRVSFSSPDPSVEEARLGDRTVFFNGLISGLTLNFDSVQPPMLLLKESAPQPLQAQQGAEVLIITHPDFTAAAESLADWKRRMGYYTRVVKTTDIVTAGLTASDIKTYIEDACDDWRPAPSFVILIGDADRIPTNYVTQHLESGSYYPLGTMVGTDLYYATFRGNDYFPDIAIGRISVDTAEQATTVISKIMDYERTPPPTSPFYTDAAVAAFFEDRAEYDPNTGQMIAPPDGYEDRRFVLTSEEMRDKLLSLGYTVFRLYCALPNITPTNYNNGSFDNGDPLPAELLRANGFAWDADTDDIIDTINGGIFLMFHRDHGSSRNRSGFGSDGWGDPYFITPNVASLTNAEELPVVFSINCETGWFDGETDVCDTNDFAQRNFECLCEELMRREGGGAVGVVGATRISYSGHNDTLAKAFRDGIWWGMWGTPAHLPMGLVLTFGKLVYGAQYGESTMRRIEFELFHYFGDPTMRIWTSAPGILNVSHPETYTTSTSSLEFTVSEDVATVSLVRNGELIGRRTSYGGTATIYFSPLLEPIAPIEVTVSKPNFRPYEGVIYPVWTRRLGAGRWERAYSVDQTSDGGYIVAGRTFDPEFVDYDVYLIKTDGAGNGEWGKVFGGRGDEEAKSVQQTSDGGYIVAGWTNSFGNSHDIYLIKTDAAGKEEWSKALGGSGSQYGWSVQQTSDGGYIVAGYTVVGGARGYDVLLIKTDADGEQQWSKTFGLRENNNDLGYSVQQTSDGGYVVAGSTERLIDGDYDPYLIKTDAAGELEWHRNLGGGNDDHAYCVQQTSDGGYVFTGWTESFGAGGKDMFLVGTGSNGGVRWSSTVGGSADEWANSIQETADGGYIVAGYTQAFGGASYDAFLVKTNSFGMGVWTKTYGASEVDEAYSVQQTADGGYIVAGYTQSPATGWEYMLLIKTDGNGNAPSVPED